MQTRFITLHMIHAECPFFGKGPPKGLCINIPDELRVDREEPVDLNKQFTTIFFCDPYDNQLLVRCA